VTPAALQLLVSAGAFAGMAWAFYPREGTVGRMLIGIACLCVSFASPFFIK
jgi:hypothetical protein